MKSLEIRTSPLYREHLNSLMHDCAVKGLSLHQLARIIGVAHQSVYSWIHEENFPTPEHYNKLADFFGWPCFKETSS